MRLYKLVQVVSIAAIGLAVNTTRTHATETESGICTACIDGLGTQCPSEESLAEWCQESGCDGSLPGCVGGFGNCQTGYRILCNGES